MENRDFYNTYYCTVDSAPTAKECRELNERLAKDWFVVQFRELVENYNESEVSRVKWEIFPISLEESERFADFQFAKRQITPEEALQFVQDAFCVAKFSYEVNG